MSEFKWVPEVGMKFKTEITTGIAMPPSEIASECGKARFYDVDTKFISTYLSGWPCTTKPRGKKAKADYAAKLAAHEASLVPEFKVGSYWVLLEDEEHFIKKNAVVKIVATTDEDGDVQAQDLSQKTHRDGLWETPKTNLRPATAEEIKAATRTVHDLDRGDRFFYLTPCGDARPAQWVCSAFDFGARKRGNIFLTRQEAEAEDARRVAANSRDGGGV